MSKLLVLFATIALASCALEDNQDLEKFYGKYKLIYAWPPPPTRAVPNCAEDKFLKTGDPVGSYSCRCDDRNPANIAVVKEDTKFLARSIFVDPVTSDEEATRAMNDKCTCEPYTLDRVQWRQINDDFFLQYEKEEILRHYIFGKRVPTENELQEIINGLGDLKNQPGKKMCIV